VCTHRNIIPHVLLQVLGQMYREVQQAAAEAKRAVKRLAFDSAAESGTGSRGAGSRGGGGPSLFQFPGFWSEVEVALVGLQLLPAVPAVPAMSAGMALSIRVVCLRAYLPRAVHQVPV